MALGHRPIGGFLPPPTDLSIALEEKGIAPHQDSSGSGVAHFIQDIFRQATDPTMVIPMLMASPAYLGGKVGLLNSFLARPAKTWLGRGLTLKVLPALGGFAAETLAFSLSSRGLSHFIHGPIKWDAPTLINDTAMTGLTLGLLKGANYLGGKIIQGTLGLKGLQPHLGTQVQRHAMSLGSQLSGYLGLVGSHYLQGTLFPGAHAASGNIWVDSLGTHLALGLGAYGGRQILGSRFHALEQGLGHQAHQLYQQAKSPFTPLGGLEQFAMAGPSAKINRDVFDTRQFYAKADPRKPAVNPFSQVEGRTPTPPSNPVLRDYQTEMLRGFAIDMECRVSPWLGIASPMQTGKSFLIGPMIEMLRGSYGPRARFIILTSARIITDQILEDLTAGFSQEEVGRFDHQQKEVRPITVASVRSLIRHLDQFEHFGPTILINDEAYSTQAKSFRTVYNHFGLGELVGKGNEQTMVPKEGHGLVVGLSGTGSGLEGYYPSEHYSLLDAIEAGWVRQMEGERVPMTLPAKVKHGDQESQMIWWNPTRKNAEALADLYGQKIHGLFKKNLIYVPTVKHAELLREVLRKRHGKGYAHTVHSKMDATGKPGTIERDYQKVIDHWEENGGALISVKMLGRGFRGTGADAVFHTYQSSSMELFSQRTGRAWGQSVDHPFAPLYVLEASWNPKGPYANLARALGLVEYPAKGFSTKGLRKKIQTSTQRQNSRKLIRQKISIGEADPLFEKIPLAEEWRKIFGQVLMEVGGMGPLQAKTGLKAELLTGYGLGALPTRREDMERFAEILGGREEALGLWVSSWESVVEEIREGVQGTEDKFTQALIEWREGRLDPLYPPYYHLDRILQKFFHPKTRPELRGDSIGRIIQIVRQTSNNSEAREIIAGLSEDELRDQVRNALKRPELFTPFQQKMIQLKYFTEPPLGHTAMAKELKVTPSWIGESVKTIAKKVWGSLVFNHYQVSDREKMPVVYFPLIARSKTLLFNKGFHTIGQLIRVKESDLAAGIGGLGETELKDIKANLAAWGLTLQESPTVEELKANPSNPSHREVLEQIPIPFDDLSVGTRNILAEENIRTLGQLLLQAADYQMGKKYISPNSLKEIKRVLAEWGLSQDPLLGKPPDAAVLDQDVYNMPFSVRILNAFQNMNIRHLGELIQEPEWVLTKNNNFGKKSLKAVKEELAKNNLTLGMDVGFWVPPGFRPRIPPEVVTPANRREFEAYIADHFRDPHRRQVIEELIEVMGLIPREEGFENPYYLRAYTAIRADLKIKLKKDKKFNAKEFKIIELSLFTNPPIMGHKIAREIGETYYFVEKILDNAYSEILKIIGTDLYHGTNPAEIPLEFLGLNYDVLSRLKGEGIHNLGDVTRNSREKILWVLVNDEKYLKEVEGILAEKGLSFLGNEPVDPDLLENTSIDLLKFSARTANFLAEANITTVGQLVQQTEGSLRGLGKLGVKSLREIKTNLASFNLSLSPPDPAVLNESIYDIPFPPKIYPDFHSLNIRYLGELVQVKVGDLFTRKGFGPSSLKRVKEALAERNLYLGMDVGAWVPPKDGPKDPNTFDGLLAHLHVFHRFDPMPYFVKWVQWISPQEVIINPFAGMDYEGLCNYLQTNLKNKGIFNETEWRAVEMRLFSDPPHIYSEIGDETDRDFYAIRRTIDRAQSEIRNIIQFAIIREWKDVMTLPVEYLPFSEKTFQVLERANITSLGDLVNLAEKDLLNPPRFKPKVIREVWETFKELGLSLHRSPQVELVPLRKQAEPIIWDVLDKYIGLQNLPWEISHPLRHQGVKYLGEVVQKTEAELLKIKGIQLEAVTILKEFLARHNLRLGQDIRPWVRPDFRLLNTPITDRRLESGTVQVLKRLNIRYLGQLVQFNESSLRILLGQDTTEHIKKNLEPLNLKLGMEVRGWIPPEENWGS